MTWVSLISMRAPSPRSASTNAAPLVWVQGCRGKFLNNFWQERIYISQEIYILVKKLLQRSNPFTPAPRASTRLRSDGSASSVAPIPVKSEPGK